MILGVKIVRVYHSKLILFLISINFNSLAMKAYIALVIKFLLSATFMLALISCNDVATHSISNTATSMKGAEIAPATISKGKCPCADKTIETGSRGGKYCIVTSKTGNTYKAYITNNSNCE